MCWADFGNIASCNTNRSCMHFTPATSHNIGLDNGRLAKCITSVRILLRPQKGTIFCSQLLVNVGLISSDIFDIWPTYLTLRLSIETPAHGRVKVGLNKFRIFEKQKTTSKRRTLFPWGPNIHNFLGEAFLLMVIIGKFVFQIPVRNRSLKNVGEGGG